MCLSLNGFREYFASQQTDERQRAEDEYQRWVRFRDYSVTHGLEGAAWYAEQVAAIEEVRAQHLDPLEGQFAQPTVEPGRIIPSRELIPA